MIEANIRLLSLYTHNIHTCTPHTVFKILDMLADKYIYMHTGMHIYRPAVLSLTAAIDSH